MALFKGIDFGLRQGLGVRIDTSKDIDNLHKNELLDRQNRIDAETKTKLFSDDLKFGKAANAWDHTVLKKLTGETITELGNYMTANPNWDRDPLQRGVVAKMKNGL